MTGKSRRGICRQGLYRLKTVAVLLLVTLLRLQGQSNPSKEYIRLGERVIAIENPGAASFGTPTTGLSLGAGSGSGSVPINTTTPAISWSVAVDATSWFHLTSGTSGTGPGTLNYSFDANSLTTSRTATLTLSYGSNSSPTLTFTQAGAGGTTLSISPTSATLNSQGTSSQSVQVTSNASWTATVTSGSPWLSITGTTSTSLTYSVTSTTSARTGVITFTAGSVQQTFTVTQNAPQVLTVGPGVVPVVYGGSYQFTAYVDGTAVSSGVGWTLTTSPSIGGHISSSGYYTAPSSGSGTEFDTIKATFGTLTNTATAEVVTTLAVPVVTSVTPNNGIGNQGSFAVLTHTTGGFSNIYKFQFGFTTHTVGLGFTPFSPDCEVVFFPTSTTAGYMFLGLDTPNDGYLPWTPPASGINPATLTGSNDGCNVLVSPQGLNPPASMSWDGSANLTVQLPVVFRTGSLIGGTTIFGTAFSSVAAYPETAFGTWTVVGAPTVGPLTPTSGLQGSQTFTAKYSYSAPATNLNSGEILINSSASPTNACNVRYDHVANLLYLRNDAGTGWLGGFAPGASTTVQNTQCTLNGTGSSASMSGSTLTVNAPITFKAGFFGSQFVYLDAVDNNKVDSGYQQLGSWTVDQAPTGVGVAPSSGSGFSQTFNFTFADPNGASDLSDVYAEINTSTASGGCTVRYLKSAAGFYLLNDAANGWLGPVAPGTANTLSNSSCSLNALSSSITTSGNDLTIAASLTFTLAFNGAKNVYLYAWDAEGLQLTATAFGTWTVPSTAQVTVTSSPSGLALSVDGTGCTAPCLFQWTPNSNHTINVATSPQAGGTGTQYVYASWSDSGARSHSITVPSSPTTYTANFTTQYYLTTAASPTAGGSISPAAGWYTSGSVVSVSASANGGYTFTGFSGGLSGTTTPQNVTVSAPVTVTANFSNGTAWYNTGGTWTDREVVTISHTKISGTANLTNFPMLYSVTDANLKTVANGGSVGKSDGTDILFTASDGLTKLNHEIESYNAATGQLVAWVQIPSVSPTTDTGIYIYYGNASASNQQNATGVWDSNYKGVWHLSESNMAIGTTLHDSTANGLGMVNGQPSCCSGSINTTPISSGEIGGAAYFSSSNQYNGAGAASAANSGLGTGVNVTIEAWANLQSAEAYDGGYNMLFGTGTSSPYDVVGILASNNNAGLSFYIQNFNDGAGAGTSYVPISLKTWYHVVATYDGSTMKEYINGSLSTSAGLSESSRGADAPLLFGGNLSCPAGCRNSDVMLDEVRISTTTRTADWIATEYNSQSSPATFFTVGGQQGNSSWYSAGGTWTNRKAVTISHAQISGSSSLTNFPMLYSVTDANLKTVANGGSVGKSDGTDILFTASDGLTKLNHEIESYNAATGQLVAWVQIPSVSPTTDTGIYIYYGNASASNQQNATGVWDSNYKGVWHLSESNMAIGATLHDSTANGLGMVNNGSTNTTPTSPGMIGGAAYFSSSNQYSGAGAASAANSGLGTGVNVTIEAWANLQSAEAYDGGYNMFFGTATSYPYNVVGIRASNNNAGLSFYIQNINDGTGAGTSYVPISLRTWYHVVATYDGSTMKEYINGSLSTSTALSESSRGADAPLNFGGNLSCPAGCRNSDVMLDEVRISTTTRTVDWIATEYNSQNSPATFFTVGGQQSH